MHFNTILTSLTLLIIFTLSANADTLVAFSGNFCDGGVGATVQCDAICIDFAGRHSFRINGTAIGHCVTYFAQSGCNGNPIGSNIDNPGVCQNVNPGGVVNSIRCSPDLTCIV